MAENNEGISEELQKKLENLKKYIAGLGSLAVAFCKERGIRHIVCNVDPLKEDGYRNNSPDRCYFCKHGIFTEVRKIALENGIEYMAEGSNADDIGDYRPGLRAAAELSVKSPLREAVYDKFREIGFLFVTLDMKGYKSGSMNATLK